MLLHSDKLTKAAGNCFSVCYKENFLRCDVNAMKVFYTGEGVATKWKLSDPRDLPSATTAAACIMQGTPIPAAVRELECAPAAAPPKALSAPLPEPFTPRDDRQILDCLAVLKVKFTRIPVEGDGDCAMHALNVSLRYSVSTMRQCVADYATQNLEVLAPASEDQCKTLINEFRKHGTWVGDEFFMVAARAFRRDIVIVSPNAEHRFNASGAADEPSVMPIIYIAHNGRKLYHPLVPMYK